MRLLGLNIRALELHSGPIPAALVKLRHASAEQIECKKHSPCVLASLPEPVLGKKNYHVLWTEPLRGPEQLQGERQSLSLR